MKYPLVISGAVAGGRKRVRHTKYRRYICQLEWLKYPSNRYLTCRKGTCTTDNQGTYSRYGRWYMADSWPSRCVSALLADVGYIKCPRLPSQISVRQKLTGRSFRRIFCRYSHGIGYFRQSDNFPRHGGYGTFLLNICGISSLCIFRLACREI